VASGICCDVWERVKNNKGAGGVDAVMITRFDEYLQ
jgi:hypothetical protein